MYEWLHTHTHTHIDRYEDRQVRVFKGRQVQPVTRYKL
jgi:hypothetical protein